MPGVWRHPRSTRRPAQEKLWTTRYNEGKRKPRNIISTTNIDSPEDVRFRAPLKQDAAAILRLVHDLGVLDPNSAYAYMLIGEHHSDTSVVAEIDGQLAGFITAYILPRHPDIVFVWQVGVAENGRGCGLATRMLFEILKRPACFDVHYMDTTIGPTNEASQGLFRGLARRLDTYVDETELFSSELFGDFDDEEHESEILFRIGPFDAKAVRAALD